MRLWVLLAAACGLCACDEPTCDNGRRQCLDYENLRDCTVTPSQVVFCPVRCEDQGADIFLGCDDGPTAADPCGCASAAGAELPCELGATTCLGTTTVLRCAEAPGEAPGGQWRGEECAAMCVSLGAQVGICAPLPPPHPGVDCFCDASSLLGPTP